ncbi:hypothetical protein HPG69_016200 [Diceros bicornis minor]|uniref:Uncharacterized protein n=1 Tax=Diceros bicornis minor TaxID=77932 RepID=A0A7J7FHX8_DICBM|nr:hypothetical protein HPG69_016200 [Diceros bicornis minor]
MKHSEDIYIHGWEKSGISEHLLTTAQLNSHLLSTCPTTAALENSPPSPLGATCTTQAPPVALPTPATWSTALTSALSVTASWAPLSTVAVRGHAGSPPDTRHPVWCPAPARGPATTQGSPHSGVPASQLTLGFWALGPAAAAPWRMDQEVAIQGAVDPVALALRVLECMASLP